MFHKNDLCPSLTRFVALALSGGVFLVPSSPVLAADVTIDSAHPPIKNVTVPEAGSAAAVGTDAEHASDSTLTVTQYQDDSLTVYGGVTLGAGDAMNNIVRIKGVATEIASVYGGAAWGTGLAKGNTVHFDAGTVSFAERLVGGYVGRSGSAEENAVEINGGTPQMVYGGLSNRSDATGRIYKNHVTIQNGTIKGKVYGGATVKERSTGDVTHNTVMIYGGTVKKTVCGGSLEDRTSTGNVAHNEITVAGGILEKNVIGGYTRHGGNLTGNIVTITGGKIQDTVYAAMSQGNVSEIKDNIVNLGDGKNELNAGYEISKYIFGAYGGNRASYAGNTLNVKASARAKNIVNFNKVDFYFMDGLQPRLTLRDSTGTKFKSLNDINVYGSPKEKEGILLENTSGGIKIKDGINSLTKTGDTAEVTLTKDTTGKKILYSRLIFKGAAIAESDGTNTWGGRSAIGNTTAENEITVQAGTHTTIYGGWTTGTDSKASDKGASRSNKVTVSGAAVTGTVYGGFTDSAGGKATENTVTIEQAITGDVIGGQSQGDATGNTVKITANVGRVMGGKSIDAAASNNTADIGSDAEDIATGAVTGGKGAAAASGNTVKLLRANVTGDVIGGDGRAANGNNLHLDRTTVTGDIIGGKGTIANGNTVRLSNTTVAGIITGSTQADGDNNTLQIDGKNTAKNIRGFQKITFNTNTAAGSSPMLTLAHGGETTLAAKDHIEVSGSTAHGKITLLHNANGIRIQGHTDGVLKSTTTDTAEQNIGIEKSGAKITSITYEGWQFAGVTTPAIHGMDVYGGISKAGNTTHDNAITVNGDYTNVYGGHTSGSGTQRAEQGNSTKNTVTITGGTLGSVDGGFTTAENGTTTGNTVHLGDGTHELAPRTQIAEIYGGNKTAAGNTLCIHTAANVGKIAHFEKIVFRYKDTIDAATPLLKLYGGAAELDMNAIEIHGKATEKPVTLVENLDGLTLKNHDGSLKSERNSEGTQETNLEVRKTGGKTTRILRYAYTFKGATAAKTLDGSTWGGRSAAGNTTTGNAITLTAGSHTNVYGGWTTGKGSKADAKDCGDSTKNTVLIKENAAVTGTVYGGFTDVADGKATENTVTMESAVAGNVVGGRGSTASGNRIRLKNAVINGDLIGGSGQTANDNVISLENTLVKGTVTGGAADGTGNTLAVFYGKKPTEIGDFRGIQNIRFHLEHAPTDGSAHTLLKLMNVSGGTKTLAHMNLHLERSGDAKKLQPGDTFTLMENMRGSITFGDGVEVTAQDGISYNYTLKIAPDQNEPNRLRATVHQAGLADEAKSPVETRAGLANFVNQGADYLVEGGISAAEMSVRVGMSGTNTSSTESANRTTDAENAAKADDAAKSTSDAAADSAKSGKEETRTERQTANAHAAPYQIWAGAGANNMRVESGSHVDSKGWNLGIGWAREDAVEDGAKHLFSPFVEYGRGSYDSYLDDGTHGSGKIIYLGIGILGKRTQENGLWLEVSARGGRAASDYQLHGKDAGYDGSNTYYGIHLGIGKTFALQNDAAVDAYARYFWSHQNAMSVQLSSGDTYDFAAVDSHRLRIGFRYSQKKPIGEWYTGLAWEQEFGGEAGANIGGDAAPSPSLKGASYMLELGYRFQPQNSRISYDLHLNGWQGKRKGLSGGASVKWAF